MRVKFPGVRQLVNCGVALTVMLVPDPETVVDAVMAPDGQVPLEGAMTVKVQVRVPLAVEHVLAEAE
ncbi:MAG: hypothetical protein BGO63_02110 [Candidatus Accumulibacter sp. 66-26]|nr:MAG: hypothetical protein BGO63_02110 [Candidatus Accumulibacter sp. 66-26]